MGSERSESLVLVVDDDRDMRRLFAQALTRAGSATRECASGREALAALLDGEVSLVLLERRMPGMDGVGLPEVMRCDPQMQAVPVITVTGETDIEDRVAGLDAGADDCVVEPIALTEPAARVRAQMRSRTMWSTAAVARAPRVPLAQGYLFGRPAPVAA